MIKLLTGLKGSGKTKHLIALAHEAVEVSKGHVVCVEKGDTLTYDVDHKARLINTEEYGIEGYDCFYGFLCGLCACNYDITDILVDSTLKIGGKEKSLDDFAKFIKKIAPICEAASINCIFSVSALADDIPEELGEIVEKI